MASEPQSAESTLTVAAGGEKRIAVQPAFSIDDEGRASHAGFDVTINGGYFHRTREEHRAREVARILRLNADADAALDRWLKDAALQVSP